jgi:hypothetical protein
LNPISLATSTRFTAKDIRDLRKLVEEHKSTFMEAWNEYFKG